MEKEKNERKTENESNIYSKVRTCIIKGGIEQHSDTPAISMRDENKMCGARLFVTTKTNNCVVLAGHNIELVWGAATKHNCDVADCYRSDCQHNVVHVTERQ